MKTISMTTAALSALVVFSFAAPASAQGRNDHRSASEELRLQIAGGVEDGSISRREASPLRNDLRQLVSLERRYAVNGISRSEGSMLERRGETLRRQINFAQRNGPYGRSREMDGRERYLAQKDEIDARFDRPNRGDRFSGDARVGQRISARMVEMPQGIRGQYRDNDQVYYRYDDDRVYQVDRRTGMILRLLDLPK